MASRNPKVGSNCIISAKNYGYFICRATDVQYGDTLVSTDLHARATETMYSRWRVAADIGLVVRFSDYDDYLAFQVWMQQWGHAWSVSGSKQPGIMQFIIPSANFNRLGVPQSPIPLGDAPEDVVWDVNLSFLAVDRTLTGKDVSTFYLPDARHIQPATPFFYPGGVQLSGDQTETDGIYDGTLTQQQIDSINSQNGAEPPPPVKRF